MGNELEDDEGLIQYLSIGTYETCTLPGGLVGLILGVFPDQISESANQPVLLPIGMTAAHAKLIGKALLLAATGTGMGQSPSTTRN